MESLVHRKNLQAIFGQNGVAAYLEQVLDYMIVNIEGGLELAIELSELNKGFPREGGISLAHWHTVHPNRKYIFANNTLYGFRIWLPVGIEGSTRYEALNSSWSNLDACEGDECSPELQINFQHSTHTKRYNIPLEYVIKNFPLITKTSGYMHEVPILDTDFYPYKKYVGITQRHWLVRFNEHLNEAKKGSFLLFHETLRNFFLAQHDLREKLVFQSTLALVNASFEESMLWEEQAASLMPYGLNMLPGGYKGVKLLHSLGLIKRKHERVMYNIDAAKERFASKLNREAGRKNKKLSDLWRTDSFYMKQVESQPRWLKLGQIEIIRSMDELGYTLKEIEAATKASECQIENLLDGKTFKRIH